jgi:hypothetical protein
MGNCLRGNMGKVITIGEVLIDFIPTSKGRKLSEVDIVLIV